MDNFTRAQLDSLEEMRKITKELVQFKELFRNIKEHELTGETTTERIIAQLGTNDAHIKVQELYTLHAGDLALADTLRSAKELDMGLKLIEVNLRGGAVVFERSHFLSMQGNLKVDDVPTAYREVRTDDVQGRTDMTRPRIQGSGTVSLIAGFDFVSLFPVASPSRIVMEKGIYVGSIGMFEFQTLVNELPNYYFAQQKSTIQVECRGTGILILELPIPMENLREIVVTPDMPLTVHADYVMMWSGNLRKRMIAGGSQLGSITKGADWLEEYTGTGKVWIAPTIEYSKLLKPPYTPEYESLTQQEGDEQDSKKKQEGNKFGRFLKLNSNL